MTLEEFTNKVEPHRISSTAPPTDPELRHSWESKQLYSVKDCLGENCSVLDYGCGGQGTLQYTLFNHYPNAKYYGLDLKDQTYFDNQGFKTFSEGNTYFGDISELEDILPKVDCMVLGSVFTHLGLEEIKSVLDKTLPHYERGFQLSFTSFISNNYTFYHSETYDPNPYYWIVILKLEWFQKYCEKHGLEVILHPYAHELDHPLPIHNLTHQNFLTIKKK